MTALQVNFSVSWKRSEGSERDWGTATTPNTYDNIMVVLHALRPSTHRITKEEA